MSFANLEFNYHQPELLQEDVNAIAYVDAVLKECILDNSLSLFLMRINHLIKIRKGNVISPDVLKGNK